MRPSTAQQVPLRRGVSKRNRRISLNQFRSLCGDTSERRLPIYAVNALVERPQPNCIGPKPQVLLRRSSRPVCGRPGVRAQIYIAPSMVDPASEWMNRVSERVLGCAIEVHRELGPGLLESIYESALEREILDAGLLVRRQVALPVRYKGTPLGELRLDLLVEECLVVEVKSVERPDPVFEAQLLSYLRLSGCRVGLLLNFNRRLLKDGIKRMVL